MNDIYKAVIRTKTSYLVHYNKKHYPAGSSKGGQFAPSDGGGSVSTRTFSDLDYDSQESFLKKNFGNRKANKWREANGMIATGYGSDRDFKKAKKFKDKIEKKADQKFQEQYKQDRGIDQDELITSLEKIRDEGKRSPDKDLREEAKIAGKIVKEEKDIIPVKLKSIDDIVGTAKLSKDQHKCSAFDGDVTVYGWTDDHSDGASIDVSGKSSTKRYRIEKKSKDGVHLIDSYKTEIGFNDVGAVDQKSIDRKKLKELNDYSMSKESRKALDAGKKLVSTNKLDMYKSWSSDPISRKLPEKYNSDNFYRDLYPKTIIYEKNKQTNNPEIKMVDFVDKYDNLAGHVISVYYENGKPKKSLLEG